MEKIIGAFLLALIGSTTLYLFFTYVITPIIDLFRQNARLK